MNQRKICTTYGRYSKGVRKVVLLSFYAMQCPDCGTWRCCHISDTATYVFRCFSCGKQRKVRQKNALGLMLKHKGPFDTARGCRNALLSLSKDPTK